MGSPPRSSREEEQRVNVRTLLIASAASATAALVTSRLWIAGTWIAAALTPVIVTLVSELLRRPTDRLARGVTTDRAALPDPLAPAAQRVAERMRGDAAPPLPRDPEAPPLGGPPPRIYRSGTARRASHRRRIGLRVVFATAALAFVIGVLALTVPELIAGSSFGKGDRSTTFFSSDSDRGSRRDGAQRTTTTTTETQTETAPPETQTDTTPSETQTTPTLPEEQPPPTSETAPPPTTSP